MSEENQEIQAKSSGLERHAQTILSGIVLALVVWMGNGVQSQGQTIVRLETQVTALQAQLSAYSSNSYTADRAEAELALRDNRLAELERRLLAAEAEIRSRRNEGP